MCLVLCVYHCQFDMLGLRSLHSYMVMKATVSNKIMFIITLQQSREVIDRVICMSVNVTAEEQSEQFQNLTINPL